MLGNRSPVRRRRSSGRGVVVGDGIVAAGRGVGVTVLCPGAVATEIWNSGRSRPDAVGGPIAPAPGMADFMRKGMDPALVAELAFDGIAREAFVIVTHPHIRTYSDERSSEVAAALDHLDQLQLDLPHYETRKLMEGRGRS
jgi:hypothetical protein